MKLITGWLIYSKKDMNRNKSYINWFLDEASKQYINLQLIIREHLQIGIRHQQRFMTYKNKPISPPLFAVVRTVEPLLNKYLELLGIKAFNSYQVAAMCNHKANTYIEMNSLGIPVIDTIFTKRNYLGPIPPMSYPFVIKESTGRGGKQVFLIQNKHEWLNTYQTFTSEDLVVQSVQVQTGKDLRVFVIGQDIVGAVLRKSKSGFRANYSLGGTATWYPLSNEERQLINHIIQAYDFDLVGIDFLLDLDGNLILNEIEDVVGSRILSAVSEINLLEKYVTHIKSKI